MVNRQSIDNVRLERYPSSAPFLPFNQLLLWPVTGVGMYFKSGTRVVGGVW